MTNSVPLYWKSLWLWLLLFWGGTGGAGGGGGGPGDRRGLGGCWLACPEAATEEGCIRPTSLGDPRLVICDWRWLEKEGGPEDPAALPPLHGAWGLCSWCEGGAWKLPISAGLGSPLVIITGCVAGKLLATMLGWRWPSILLDWGDFGCCPSAKNTKINDHLFHYLPNYPARLNNFFTTEGDNFRVSKTKASVAVLNNSGCKAGF